MAPILNTIAAVVVICTVVVVSSPEVSGEATPTILNIKSKFLFDVAVMKNPKTPFVVFYYSSTDCVPCKWSLLPMLEKMVRRKAGALNLAMVDFDRVPELREEHGVSELPTIMVFYKGDVMDVVEGKNWNPIVGLVNRAAKLAN